jgi:hypothetical protein
MAQKLLDDADVVIGLQTHAATLPDQAIKLRGQAEK